MAKSENWGEDSYLNRPLRKKSQGSEFDLEAGDEVQKWANLGDKLVEYDMCSNDKELTEDVNPSIWEYLGEGEIFQSRGPSPKQLIEFIRPKKIYHFWKKKSK